MYGNDDFVSVRAALQEAVLANQQSVQALLALRKEMAQREQNIREAFDEQLQALRNDVQITRREVAAVVGGAKTLIAEQAQQALTPVTSQYERAIAATSGHLRSASRTVWLWFAAGATLLLCVLLVGWALLGYYRRELATAKDELQRYENAIPVLQAYYASDATICGQRVCVNVDPDAPRSGDKRQYRTAKPRP